jgi:hypothetical protein
MRLISWTLRSGSEHADSMLFVIRELPLEETLCWLQVPALLKDRNESFCFGNKAGSRFLGRNSSEKEIYGLLEVHRKIVFNNKNNDKNI